MIYRVRGEQYTSGEQVDFQANTRAGAIALLESMRTGTIASMSTGAELARKVHCSQRVSMSREEEA